jgi:fructosamine-3-kinase
MRETGTGQQVAQLHDRYMMMMMMMPFAKFIWRGRRTIEYEALGNTRWRRWMKYFATSRKVAGSILEGATEIFH